MSNIYNIFRLHDYGTMGRSFAFLFFFSNVNLSAFYASILQQPKCPILNAECFFFHRNILQCIFIINEHAFIWNEVRQMKCNASVLNRIVSWSRCDLIICLFTVHMTHLELAMQFHFHYQLFVLTVQFYTVYTSFKK